jgi:hypothetical protein
MGERYLDGARLVRWLENEVEWASKNERLLPLDEMRICRWRRGAQASFQLVDEVLTRLEIPPSWLPDALWRNYDNGKRSKAA